MRESTRRTLATVAVGLAFVPIVVALVVSFAAPEIAKPVLYATILVEVVLIVLAAVATAVSGERDVARMLPRGNVLPEIVIRCRSCSEVFAVVDSGERPLTGVCPHCGKSGTVRRASPE